MKRRITLSIALAVSVLVSLVSLSATAQGQQQRRFFAYDTGVFSAGTGQILRLTVAGGSGNDTIAVRFRRMRYTAEGCNSEGVCRHTLAADDLTEPVTLNCPLWSCAASIDIPGDGNGVRVVAVTNSRNARVTAQIIDSTGQVTSIIANLIAL